jgi:hypothetical protein
MYLGLRMNLNKSPEMNNWERRQIVTKCLDIFNKNMVSSGKPEISKNCRGSEGDAVQYRDPSFMAPVQPPAGRRSSSWNACRLHLVSSSTMSRVVSEVSTMMLISPFYALNDPVHPRIAESCSTSGDSQ